MLRRTGLITVAFLILVQGVLFGEDWIPPSEPEPPVIAEDIDEGLLLPLGIASIGTAAAGLAVTAVGLYSIYSNIAGGYNDEALQSGIILSISGGILTAAASVVFSFIISETELFE